MIQKVSFFLAAVFLGVLCASVVQAETLRGEGKYVEKSLAQMGPFHAIEVRGDIEVDVWQQPDAHVTLSGKQNLVALADVRVENEKLVVDFKRPVQIKGDHDLHVAVAVPHLTEVAVHSDGRVRIRGGLEAKNISFMAADTGYITGDGLQADSVRVQAVNKAEIDLERMHVKELEVASFDYAEVELSGHTETARLTNNGRSDLEASDLRADHVYATVNGKGDVEVFATHSLTAHANGNGKVEYHGQPTLTRSGDMKKIRPAFED